MDFKEEFEKKVMKETKKLIKKDKKLLVAVSGGKDSITILYLLHKWGYDVEALMIDLGFRFFKEHVDNAREFCRELGIKLHIASVKKELGRGMRELQLRAGKSNCFTCGVIKRWLINRKAKELGFEKVVTGHNLDDYAESILMNIFMNNRNASRNLRSPFRIKPLNYIPEKEIEKYAREMGFKINYEACPYSDNAFRRLVLNMMREYEISAMNVVKMFEKTSMKEEGKFRKCSICGGPSSGEICNACRLINLIKKK